MNVTLFGLFVWMWNKELTSCNSSLFFQIVFGLLVLASKLKKVFTSESGFMWHAVAGVALCNRLWLGEVYCGLVWFVVALCGLLWLTVVCCGLVWCIVALCVLLWLGVVCCGFVWFVVVWCDLLWLGVA